ncbi:MAG: 4Fe-4S dicluster domain-containing protein [Oscillospiraceae bacterium]|jgi:carbon-monoxide dehydrogenase iron sulfur subunit|nr:4Fe-4S dicluster domain-containing protein [Oscillospiraceae bacterium]
MKRIFIQRDKCEACLGCSLACMQAHRPDEGTLYDLNLADPIHESRSRICLDKQGRVTPMFCRHCDDPKCVKACMSGAMTQDAASGQVRYDGQKCAACFMCVMNCPYGVIKPDRATKAKVIKCDFCVDDAEGPSCVRNCPKKAIYVEEVLA